MTTIAFYKGILAADTQYTAADTKTYGHKIDVLSDGRVVTSAGIEDDGLEFNLWLLGERKKFPRIKKAFEALVLDLDGTPTIYRSSGIPIPLQEEIYTNGTGWSVARAGILCGLNAKQAVELAGEVDSMTNTLVDTYDVKTKKLTLTKFPKPRIRT